MCSNRCVELHSNTLTTDGKIETDKNWSTKTKPGFRRELKKRVKIECQLTLKYVIYVCTAESHRRAERLLRRLNFCFGLGADSCTLH